MNPVLIDLGFVKIYWYSIMILLGLFVGGSLIIKESKKFKIPENYMINLILYTIVLGIIGSVIPVVTIVFGYTYLYDKMGGVLFSSLIKLVKPLPFVFNLSIVVIAIGILVGMIGSARAVRRYVKI